MRREVSLRQKVDKTRRKRGGWKRKKKEQRATTARPAGIKAYPPARRGEGARQNFSIGRKRPKEEHENQRNDQKQQGNTGTAGRRKREDDPIPERRARNNPS